MIANMIKKEDNQSAPMGIVPAGAFSKGIDELYFGGTGLHF